MDWLEHMNQALDYIEEHLEDKIDYGILSQIACCPPGLFQRIFAVLADLSLSEYIRRRRLTKAAFDLCTMEEKIIDVAVKYGYESPDAFAVAFKRLHNVLPSETKKLGVMLKAYQKLTFKLIVKGDIEMNYHIEQKPAFQVIGKVLVTSNENEGQNQSIPKFWLDCNQNGTLSRLSAMGGNSITNDNLLGVCYGAQSNGTFNYMIGVGTEGTTESEGMQGLEIPASTWAVFESIGPMPNAIQEVWMRVMGDFLPNSAYKHAGTPDFELYYPGENDSHYRSEVWIPVVKK